MSLYRSLGVVLLVLSSIFIVVSIISFPFTDDYVWAGIVSLIILVLSILLMKWGKSYGISKSVNKKPFWLIISSFVFAFVPPLLVASLLSILSYLDASYEEFILPFLLFLFVTGPIGAILFIVGVVLLFLQKKKK